MEKADLIAFSTYIWNVEVVEMICKELRKVLPNAKIWLGGPEVSYNSKEYLLNHNEVDGIMVGEGEETFKELLNYYARESESPNFSLEDIKGLTFRKNSNIIQTGLRPLLDFSDVPFPYDNLDDLEHKIIYYESSRGCPFSCSYCLSSVDKTIRLRNIELVKEELNFFLERKVKQVKFVDRTFNCNKRHTREVWKHIMENDNGVTNFHFEVAADLLTDEEISLLNSMRSGLVQLEIGVQSTNPDTIKAISRITNFDKISENVKKVYANRNVHQHLDLIAGLPYEDYESFKNSFNEVYALKPDQLQLGFLKVLKGTPIVRDAKEYGIVHRDIPPYEVLFTNWLSFDDVLSLKLVEEMVEVYYNSSQFDTAITFMEHYFDSYFDLYRQLGEYYKKHGLLDLKHTRLRRYEILLDFMKPILSNLEGFKEMLIYDLYLREKLKSRPKFATSDDDKKDIYRKIYSDRILSEKYLGISNTNYSLGMAKRYFHVESFKIDPLRSAKEGKYIQDPHLVLFNYKDRDPMNNNANTKRVKETII
ncbi:MAG: B12-binding domain-containing radical SAM protein, partial [Clostridiales bacterium]|nr:B12-binding domain-containing radical SAM protein [Clostridiales bacterium]